MNLDNNTEFAHFIKDQDDLFLSVTDRVASYTLMKDVFSKDTKHLETMLTSIMLVAMKLYREWLLAHGVKGIPETEKRLSKINSN